MASIQTLTGLLGLSVASGINLYAVVLVVGLSIRYGWLRDIPPELQPLAHPLVLAAAGALYLVEFIADKIPFVTPIWDAAHTLIRPLGAAALALGVTAGWSPAAQVMASLAAGSLALGAHSGKMGFRLLAHASPEPASHSILSVLEDVGVVGLLILTYQHPWIALAVLVALIGAIAFLSPLLVRTLRFAVRGIAGRLVAWIPGIGARQTLPCPRWLDGRLAEMLPGRGERIYRCFARSLPRTPRIKAGYLVWAPDRRFFACKRFFRPRVRPAGEAACESALYRGAVFDVLVLKNAGNRQDSFYLVKDWSKALQARVPGLAATAPGHTAASAAR